MSGYSGENGDANTKCVSTASAPSTVGDGSPCLSSNDCSVFSTCSVGLTPHVCIPLSKACPGGDCSGHGTCSYQDIASGNTLTTCLQRNASCAAVCTCSGNYTTSDCSLTKSELMSKQSMRNTLISSLVNVTAASNPTADNLMSWSNSIASMTQVPEEVTVTAANNVMNIASTILTNAGGGTVSSSDLSGTMNALNSVATQVSSDQLLSMVNTYGSLVSGEMYPGQSSSDLIQNNFRMSSVVLGNSAGSTVSELTTPVTYAESLTNVQPMKMLLPNNTDSSRMHLLVNQM